MSRRRKKRCCCGSTEETETGFPCDPHPIICPHYDTGETALVVDSQDSGTDYVIDPDRGLSKPSHKFTFTPGSTKKIKVVLKDNILDNEECLKHYSLFVCLNFLKSDITSSGSFTFTIRQGANTGTVKYVATPVFSSSEWVKYSFSLFFSAHPWIDRLQPLELLLEISENYSGDEDLTVHLDNICIRVGYQCYTTNAYAVDVSGASFAFPATDLPMPGCDSSVPGPGVAWTDYCACLAEISARENINEVNFGSNLSAMNITGTVVLDNSYQEEYPGYGRGVPAFSPPATLTVSLVPSSTYHLGKCSATIFITFVIPLSSGGNQAYLYCQAIYTCSDFLCDASNSFTFASKNVDYGLYSPGGCAASPGARRHILPDGDVKNLFVVPGSLSISPV